MDGFLGSTKIYLYVFERPVPLTEGPLAERSEYYIYATTRADAFKRFNTAHEEHIKNTGYTPRLLRREAW